MPPTVFIDRDDTILDTHTVTANDPIPGDLYDASRVRLMPGAGAALKKLKQAGFTLVVYSSQGGVARGSGTLADTEVVNDRMRELLAAEIGVEPGQVFAGVYYCPFHPKGSVPPFNVEHDWRKPAPGMVLAAAAELGLDLKAAWAVGDKPRDVECAVNAGVARERCILLRTSGEAGTCADLVEAVGVILGKQPATR